MASLLVFILVVHLVANLVNAVREVSITEIEENYDIWDATGITDYDMTFSWFCFCIPCFVFPKRLEIRNRNVTQVDFDDPADADDKSCDFVDYHFLLYSDYDSIDNLFNEILFAYAGIAASIRASFDTTYGYPNFTYIDIDERIADEEIIWSINDFSQCSDEFIKVSSLDIPANVGNKDVYIGNYYLTRGDSSISSSVDDDDDDAEYVYPTYELENGYARIGARPVVNGRRGRVDIYIEFYDPNNNNILLSEYSATRLRGRQRPIIDDNNGAPYVLIRDSRNPFDGDGHPWRNVYTDHDEAIDIVSTLYEGSCQHLGFDIYV